MRSFVEVPLRLDETNLILDALRQRAEFHEKEADRLSKTRCKHKAWNHDFEGKRFREMATKIAAAQVGFIEDAKNANKV
jgi:hypothetical protein